MLALPVREVWIEMYLPVLLFLVSVSLPVREVWIEIDGFHFLRRNSACHFP